MYPTTKLLALLYLCAVSYAACIPAQIPDEDTDSSSNGSTGLQCGGMPQSELQTLGARVINDLRYLSGNMTTALMSSSSVDADDASEMGFYRGKQGRCDPEMLAYAVMFLCCSVPHTLDVLKQEAVNPMFNVSSYFHSVYDILDPADEENLTATLRKIVFGANLNNCVIPNQSANCHQMSLEELGGPIFVATLAQNYKNLATDILHSLNNLLENRTSCDP